MRGTGVAAALLGAGLCCFSSTGVGPGSKGPNDPDPDLVIARQSFFGIENVDIRTGAVSKDKVLFSWLTNTTYAVSIKGRIVLLDTFATRLEVTPGRTSFVIKDMV